jgi:hypothetical protein
MIFENKKRCRGHHGPHRLATAAPGHRRTPPPGRPPPAGAWQPHATSAVHTNKSVRVHTQRERCRSSRRGGRCRPSRRGGRCRPPRRGGRCRPPSRVKPSWGRGPGRRAGKGSRPPSRAGEDVQAAAPGRGPGRHTGEGGAGLAVPPYAPPPHLTLPLLLTAGEGRTEGGGEGRQEVRRA